MFFLSSIISKWPIQYILMFQIKKTLYIFDEIKKKQTHTLNIHLVQVGYILFKTDFTTKTEMLTKHWFSHCNIKSNDDFLKKNFSCKMQQLKTNFENEFLNKAYSNETYTHKCTHRKLQNKYKNLKKTTKTTTQSIM